MKNRIIKANLDKAAYYLLKGAILTTIERRRGLDVASLYTLEVPEEVNEQIKAQPLVGYQAYMAKRRKLKYKDRKMRKV